MPSASDGHGWLIEDDTIEPKWNDGIILPARLADLLQQDNDTGSSDDDSEEENGINVLDDSDSDNE